jgi:UDP-N-acetyl-D-galactosamine dehydrogenase
MENKTKIAIVGLGYVGLPLAIEFGKVYETIGFDINLHRVNELNNAIDVTHEIESVDLRKALSSGLFSITADKDVIADCNVYIVTVPTPIDKYNRPDLTPLFKASETVGTALKKGDIVIYESTVYPGATEEECVPVLEKFSNLKYNQDFFVGYSPERINPGDKKHTVTKILKITSGSTSESADYIDNLYKSIISAGTYKANSIKVAEAAKVIENSQRDINIAFVNELAKIFNILGIDTNEVLEAAATKWNFLKFKPGLVGGHCIGVDPFYLAQKAQEVGYHPEIILAGRRTNDGMGKYVAKECIKLMIKSELNLNNSKVLILGFTFKENCPDVRNTRVIDIYAELKAFGIQVDVFDPVADRFEIIKEFGIEILPDCTQETLNQYSAVILAVAHDSFSELHVRKKSNLIVYDVKGFLKKDFVSARL